VAAEAWRRGVEGVSEPLVSAGKLVRDDDGGRCSSSDTRTSG
jgi:hypothetical protein